MPEFFVAIPTLANAGTVLMWAGMFHAWIGSPVLGLIEGFLLYRLFGSSLLKSIAILTLANFASTVVGVTLFALLNGAPLAITIENLTIAFAVMIVLAFIITVVVEFPFVRSLLDKSPGRNERGMRATLVLQSATYILLLGLYGSASIAGFMTQLDVVDARSMNLPEGYDLYYTSQVDSRPVVRRLSDKAEDAAVDSTGPDESPHGYHGVQVLAREPRWNFETFGGWIGVITATHSETGETFSCALETPLVTWHILNATHIDGDFLVFELSNDQVCVLDPNTRRIALIARGTDPVVVRRAGE